MGISVETACSRRVICSFHSLPTHSQRSKGKRCSPTRPRPGGVSLAMWCCRPPHVAAAGRDFHEDDRQRPFLQQSPGRPRRRGPTQHTPPSAENSVWEEHSETKGSLYYEVEMFQPPFLCPFSLSHLLHHPPFLSLHTPFPYLPPSSS